QFSEYFPHHLTFQTFYATIYWKKSVGLHRHVTYLFSAWVGQLVAIVVEFEFAREEKLLTIFGELCHPVRLVKPHRLELAGIINQRRCRNPETPTHGTGADLLAAG